MKDVQLWEELSIVAPKCWWYISQGDRNKDKRTVLGPRTDFDQRQIFEGIMSARPPTVVSTSCQLTDQLTEQVTDQLTDQLTDQVTDQLTDQLTKQQANQPANLPAN